MKTPPILLVEDNPDDIDLTLRAMRRCGMAINVTVVRDGAQALDYLLPETGESTPTPQLIVLDINMPRINGLDVLRQIRENTQTQDIPVILLTTSDDNRDVDSGYELGANGYIQKPLNAEVFGRTLDDLGLREAAPHRDRATEGKSP